ncbi:MAG: sensor histidine kinase [Bryobacteraceae bacterium]
MSVRARLTVIFTSLFGAIVIVLALSLYLLEKSEAYKRLDTALDTAASATSMSAEHELNENPTQRDGERDLQSVLNATQSPALKDTQILVCERDRCAAYKPALEREFDLRRVSPAGLKSGSTVAGFRIATHTLRLPRFSTSYEIYAAKPIGPAFVQLGRIRAALLLFVPVGLVLAGLGGYSLANRSLRPLRELARVIDEVTSSDLSRRVKPQSGSGDEVFVLGSRFNALLDRLQAAFSVQRRFMADASHQIRTPVTIALASAQVTNHDPNATLVDCKEALQIIENQMLQLRKIVENMFFLSQSDAVSLNIDRKPMYFDDAVSEAVRAAKPLARGKQQALTVMSLPEARCLGDESLIAQALLVLLDNAVKFTPDGGMMEVKLFERDGYWISSVSDSGIGISEAARPRIFERFFKENRQGNDTSGGAGLGLAIAKSIVESHGGTLKLVESRPGLTTFEIAIPALEGDESLHEAQANSLAVRM